MKGIRKVFIVAIFVPLLTSCWSRTEVNDVAMVLGVALDRGEHGKIRLALQIAIPKALGGATAAQSSGGPKSTIMVSAEGENIMEAYRIIQGKLPREIFFAHSRVIIVGQKLARDGVSPVLDFFSRHRQSHLRSYLLFTKGNALDVLKTAPQLEPVIAEQIREQEKTGVGLQVPLREFLKRMLTEGEEPAAARISPLPLEANTSENETEGSTASQSTPSLNGTAVFQDDRLMGWLNLKETRGVLWLRNELKSGILTVTTSTEKKGGKVGVQIIKGSTNIKPIFYNDTVKIRVETYGTVEVFENTSTLDLSEPKAINTLQSLLEQNIEKRIHLTLDRIQKKFKSDIFGFGQAVYRTDPKKWENKYKKRWSEIFPYLEVEVTSHITVSGTGFSTESLSIPETKK